MANSNNNHIHVTAAEKKRAKAQRKRKNAMRRLTLWGVIAVVAIGLCVFLYRFLFVGGPGIDKNTYTAQELRGDVLNILVAGIDYEDGRDAKLTDVIMYVTIDIKNNKISLLQIPRDTYVGDDVQSGGTNKINALYNSGPNKDVKIQNLVNYVHEKLQLNVDHYVTIDMQAFKEIVDRLGGIEIFVPERMELDGNVVEQGLQTIDGTTAEFIVRYRNYAQKDIKRLDMQRYVYSALFKKFKSFPLSDVIKVLPAYVKYVDTDMSVKDMGSIFLKLSNVEAKNIVMCKIPGEPVGGWYSCHKQELADILNTYFRPYTDKVDADGIKLIELANTGPAIGGVVQTMDDVNNNIGLGVEGNKDDSGASSSAS